jgi:PleD family two-component response regulator
MNIVAASIDKAQISYHDQRPGHSCTCCRLVQLDFSSYTYAMSLLRILLVDDHEVVRLGLKSLLDRHADFEVVAEAAAESEAVEKAIEHERWKWN